MRTAVHPRLYDPSLDDPLLKGLACANCSRAYFPPIGLGCECCGAAPDLLVSKSLPAVGTVFAVAEVNVDSQGTAPFVVAEVVLDAGPLIRAVVHPESSELRIGERVSARWHVVGRHEDGSELVEPAFASATRAGGAKR